MNESSMMQFQTLGSLVQRSAGNQVTAPRNSFVCWSQASQSLPTDTPQEINIQTKQKLYVSNKQSFKINFIYPFPAELQVLVLLIRNSGTINVNLTSLGQPATQT